MYRLLDTGDWNSADAGAGKALRSRCDFASFLGALRRVQRIFSRKADREQEQMKVIMLSASAHARALSAPARPRVLQVLARARLM